VLTHAFRCDFFGGPFEDSQCKSPATKFFRNNGNVFNRVFNQQHYAWCEAHEKRIEKPDSFEPLTYEEYVVATVMES
jgi:hypothetical protein